MAMDLRSATAPVPITISLMSIPGVTVLVSAKHGPNLHLQASFILLVVAESKCSLGLS